MNISYSKHTLENGLDVLIHEDRAARSSSVNIWYHVGSKNETPGRTGFAHFFEHLMFEGSEHHDRGYFQPLQGAGALAERIDQRRPHELLGSGADQRVRARAVDGVGPHGLPAAGADRGEVLEPARRRAERAAPELREPAVRPRADGDAGGDLSARSSVSLADDRRRSPIFTPRRSKKCAQFFATYYHPANASIAIAGDVDTDDALATGPALLRGDCAGAASQPVSPPEPVLQGETRLLIEDRVELPRIYLAWITPSMFAADDAELDLAADILANGKTSRLYRRLVYEMRDRDRRVGGAEFARSGRLRAGRRDGRTRPYAGRARTGHRRRNQRSWRPTVRPATRSNGAASRPKRSSSTGCRRSADSAASPISSTPTTCSSRTLASSPATWRATTTSRAESLREAVRRYLANSNRVALSVVPKGKTVFALPGSIPRSFHESARMIVDRSRLPSPGTPPPFHFPAIDRSTLPNGLRVWSVPHSSIPVATVMLLIRRGAADDPSGQEGLAAITTDMLDEGTGALSSIEIHEALARVGAQLDSDIGPDATLLTVTVLSRFVDAGALAARRHRCAVRRCATTTSSACGSCACTGWCSCATCRVRSRIARSCG